MDKKEMEKKSYLLRSALESPARKFICDSAVLNSVEKRYHYVSEDRRLLAFANDTACMNSDCFILYAVAHMGVADKQSISDFLKALSMKNPALSIVYEKTRDSLESRLRTLFKLGFLFCYSYKVTNEVNGKTEENTISLYTLGESGRDVARQRLQRPIAYNGAIQYKQLSEIVGWASASRVGSSIAANSSWFVDYLDRVLRTKQIGTYYFPMEMKFRKDDVAYYVAVIESYLGFDDKIHTKESYAERCVSKINAIKNYLHCRTTKGVSVVVVAVEDNADLMELSNLIYRSEILNPYLDRVLFTGEMVADSYDNESKRWFLQMCLDSSEDMGYRFECVEAAFL